MLMFSYRRRNFCMFAEDRREMAELSDVIIGHTNHGILTWLYLNTYNDILADLKGINSAVSPRELPNDNIVNDNASNLNNNSYRFSNLCDKVIDENIVNLTKCKYYSISEYYNSIGSNNFNIFPMLMA